MVTAIIFLLIIALVGKAFGWFGCINFLGSFTNVKEKVAMAIPYLIMGVIPTTIFVLLLSWDDYPKLEGKPMFWVLSIGGTLVHIGAIVLFYLTFLI